MSLKDDFNGRHHFSNAFELIFGERFAKLAHENRQAHSLELLRGANHFATFVDGGFHRVSFFQSYCCSPYGA
jgi:hypothetical protein